MYPFLSGVFVSLLCIILPLCKLRFINQIIYVVVR